MDRDHFGVQAGGDVWIGNTEDGFKMEETDVFLSLLDQPSPSSEPKVDRLVAEQQNWWGRLKSGGGV